MSIPFCCGNALAPDISVPGYEYRCPECGTRYEFFDGFKRVAWSSMTDSQRATAVERGWIEPKEVPDNA